MSNLTHFLVHGIEDCAGIRSERVRNRPPTDFIIDYTSTFPRPTIGYMFELLLLKPDDEHEDSESGEGESEDRGERMGILKLVLVATMLRIPGIDKDWEKGRSKSWRKAFKRCLGGNGLRGLILTLLDKAGKGD